MDERGLDYIIATTPYNVFYLSGFSSPNQNWLRATFAGVIYPRDASKQPILVLSKSEAELLSTHLECTIQDVRFYGEAFVNDDGRQNLMGRDVKLRE